jgi:hypothetical protein
MKEIHDFIFSIAKRGIISIVRGKKPGFSEKPGFSSSKPQVIEKLHKKSMLPET